MSHRTASLRWLPTPTPPPLEPCSRCRAQGCPWDRLDGAPLCPDCQQLLLLGQGDPIRIVPVEGRCAVCRVPRVVRYQTSPLRSQRLLEIDLCPDHLEALLGRRMSPRALARLALHLEELGLSSAQIFLLHESFYDTAGRALQPVPDDY